ncbi:MAG: archaea-specific SMC-related protein [Halobacteriales archaeon]
MSQKQTQVETVELEAENIGGIDRTETELSPGVTVLSGRNATNRTSFLQAIMAACGSDRATLKADADEGSVSLSIGGEEYTREYVRRNGTVVDSGDPYLEDATVADLFAFLTEPNEARRAVEQGEDLREIIMRPVDTDRIEAEIRDLEDERADVEAELEELNDLERRLPDLEAERQARIDAIEETRAELEEVEAEIDELDEDLQETREEKSDLDEKLDELGEVRNDLQSVRNRIESEEKSIEALEEEREELEADLETYSEIPDSDLDAIDEEMSTIRGRIQEVDATIDELGSIIQFNEDLLEDGRPELAEALEAGGDGDVTDGLVADDGITCWTCGSEVAAADVESTLDRLRSLRDEKLTRRGDLDEDLEELKTEKIEIEEKRRQHDQVTESLGRIETEIETRTERVADLKERREELTERVSELEAAVEDRETEDYSEVLEVHREANELEFELERLEDELDDIEAEIDRIEARLEDRESLRARREDIQDELAELRTRVEQLEADAIEQFNEHMASILELLEYENLERIWIERTEPEGGPGRSGVEESRFDLHVVRSTETGTVYEDRIDHLSESEREVTGVVFALAGYLVHEVHEEVPFMLLDSIESIDSDRIARLVEYIADYTDYLVVALLEEDAAALDDEHERITGI